jgi:predicted ATP-dependent serine protease
MSKKDVLINFVKSNPIANKKQAFETAIANNIECSYAYFNHIWNAQSLENEVAVQTHNEVVTNQPHEVKLTNIGEIVFGDEILIPIKSNTILDELISNDKGIMPATVTVVPGESGVGKTTVLLHHFSQIKKTSPEKTLLYVSSEMNSIHIFKYSKRIDLNGVNLLMLSESVSPQKDFEAILSEGWDVVLLDSLADTINKIRLETGMTEKAAESYVLGTMDSVRRGNNKKNKYTAFLCTHHMTKGKEYTGSTNLKHMTDAMMELRTDAVSMEDFYISYSKNRDGKKNVKLYFTIGDSGVEYNENRYRKDSEVRERLVKLVKLLIRTKKTSSVSF